MMNKMPCHITDYPYDAEEHAMLYSPKEEDPYSDDRDYREEEK